MRTNSEQTERILELKNEYLRKQAIRKKYLMLVLPSVALIAIILTVTVATAFGSSKASSKAPAQVEDQDKSYSYTEKSVNDGYIISTGDSIFTDKNKSNEANYAAEGSYEGNVDESTETIANQEEITGNHPTTSVATTIVTTNIETLQPSVTPTNPRTESDTNVPEVIETTLPTDEPIETFEETFATDPSTEEPTITETTAADKGLTEVTNYYDGFKTLSFSYEDRFYSNACYAYTTSILKDELIDKQTFESPTEKKTGYIYSINCISRDCILLLCFEDGEYEESYVLYSYNGDVPFFELTEELSLKELVSRAAKMEGNIEVSTFQKMFENGYEPKDDFSNESFTKKVGTIRILSGAKSGFHTTFALNASVYTTENEDLYYVEITLSSLDSSMYFARSCFLYNP